MARFTPLLATPTPTLATPPTWVLSPAPRPDTVVSAPWPKNVLDTLPWAWAWPVLITAVPSEVLAAVPWLAAVTGPMASRSPSLAPLFDTMSAS